MANSVDLDQLASEEANWSGSTLFVKTVHLGSAGLGLKYFNEIFPVLLEMTFKYFSQN